MFRNPLSLKLIHLHLSGLSWKSIETILAFDPNLEAIYSLRPIELVKFLRIKENIAQNIYTSLKYMEPNSILERYRKENVHVITILDHGYPEILKNIYQPPWILYCKGDVSLLKEKWKLAIVGSRKPSSYGIEVTKWLVKELAEHNIIVVSGFAKGIDTIAHEGTIQSGGKTIGVLGGGFYHLYPKENTDLALFMENEHLLISEYPPYVPPKKIHFPERNRIISGLTLGTVVVEAKGKSGSLITANFALEQGREVFAIPGPITSEYSIGTNQLIQQGAKLVMKVEDIFEELKAYCYKPDIHKKL